MPKKTKTDLENKNWCAGCDACCRYIATELDKPTTKRDYDNIIWFLLHENVGVYIDWDNDWYIEFKTPCRALKNKLCLIYQERPMMCQEYDQAECTHHNHEAPEKIYFHNADEFKKYLNTNKKNKKKNKK